MRRELFHRVVCEILEEYGELSTGDIQFYFKERMPKRVPCICGITNILSRSPKISKTGYIEYVENGIRRRYNTWRLKVN